MDTLLPELTYEIVSHLQNDPVTLCNLSLCSKRFLLVCRQTLYRDIIFTDVDSEGPPCGVRFTTHKLFATLARVNTTLARHVRRFHFAPSGPLWSMMSMNHKEPSVREDLIMSLKLMVNLKYLAIHIWDEPEVKLTLQDALGDCTFQLEYLSCSFDIYQRHMQLPLDQSHLKQLRLWAAQSVTFPQVHSPRLTVVGGDTRTIENILPNNNEISSLLWKRSSEDPIPLTSALIQGFDDLHTLCIESSYYWDIKFLAPCLQHLEVLHFIRDQERTFIQFESELADVPLLRGLRVFIHSDQHKYKLGYTSMLEQARVRNSNASKIEAKTLVQEWFKQLPRFRAAYFQIANALRVEESFLVWERDRTGEYRMADGIEVWNISPWS